MLGKNIDREEERLFDERKMSVLLTSDHPLTADSEQTAQEDIKGSKLHITHYTLHITHYTSTYYTLHFTHYTLHFTH